MITILDYEMGLESRKVLSIHSVALNSYISKLGVLMPLTKEASD